MTNLFCSGFSFTVAMKEETFILLWLTTTLVVPTGKINNLLTNLLHTTCTHNKSINSVKKFSECIKPRSIGPTNRNLTWPPLCFGVL